MPELLDRFRGCLLGLAVGDALGMPLDGLTAEEVLARHGQVTEMLGGGRWMVRPGQVSNPTSQMLCVLDSYTETSTFDPHDISERLLNWFNQDGVDVCLATRGACSNLRRGYNFERAAQDAWQTLPDHERIGSQCLPRVAPVGLLHYHDEIHLIGKSRVVCGITHHDERCRITSACLGLAISHLLLADVHSLVDELLAYCEPRNAVVGNSIKATPVVGPADLRTDGFVQDTLQAAIWVTVFCESFEEGLVLLANLGGQSSTVCSVGGALLGARFGVEAIPKRWLDVLQQRDQLDRSARRLFELAENTE